MTQQNARVVITTAVGFNVTADDATVKGQGTAAYGAIQNRRDVTVNNNGEITFIPYHAIDHAVITLTTSTVADPVDDVCPDNSNSSGGGTGGDPTEP